MQRNVSLDLDSRRVTLVFDDQHVAIKDQWSPDGFLNLPRAAGGHELWYPVNVTQFGEEFEILLCHAGVRFGDGVKWTVDRKGELTGRAATKVDMADLTALCVGSEIGGAFLLDSVLRNRHKLDSGLMACITKDVGAASDEWAYKAAIQILLRRISGDIQGNIPEAMAISLPSSCPVKVATMFIDVVLLGDTPRNPNAAIRIVDELLLSCEATDRNELLARRAKALFFANKFLEARNAYDALASGDAEFWASGDIHSYASTALASGQIEAAQEIVKKAIASRLKDRPVGHLCNLYMTIAKLGILDAGTLKAFLLSGEGTEQPVDAILSACMLGQAPTIDELADMPLVRALAAAVYRHFDRLGEEAQREFWNFIAELLLEIPERAIDREFAEDLIPKVSASYAADLERVMGYLQGRSFFVPASFDEKRKSIALTLSGFLRSYHESGKLRQQIKVLSERYNVFVFLSVFDRLGNFRVPPSTPKGLVDYFNGGFEREVLKTKRIQRSRVFANLPITQISILPRLSDDHYLGSIGIKHPQWLMVHSAFELANRFQNESGVRFSYAARLRLDNLPRDPEALLRGFKEFDEGDVSSDLLVMARWSLGTYKLSDRIALGKFEKVKYYCSIGRGRNFVDVENTEEWKSNVRLPYQESGGSHESHLGAWLKEGGVHFERRAYLDA